jgi:hypothetical protein
MSYKEKYLKYKNKYIKLKNQIGGTILAEGTIVTTLSNNGERENMVYQCFWISILNFLNFFIKPDLSLKELRTNVGLYENTERTMFDSFDPDFNEAAQYCAFLYNLTINIYEIDRDGKIKRHSGTYGNGENIVNIAMFGQSHFELIDLHNGEEFVPAVIYQNDLTKINDIDNKDIRPAYLNVVELTEKLKDLYKMQKENNKIINVLEESINDMSNNTDKSKEYKRAFINAISDKIENIKTELNSLKVEIQLHEADLSGQEAAIQLHEAELNDLEAAIQLHKVKLSDLEVARQLQKKEWNK